MIDRLQRRWLRYSLRTLFVVVTVFGCWMAYQLNWIRQREKVLASGAVGIPIKCMILDEDVLAPPWPLGWFGAEPWPELMLRFDAPIAEVERIQSLFPESYVHRN